MIYVLRSRNDLREYVFERRIYDINQIELIYLLLFDRHAENLKVLEGRVGMHTYNIRRELMLSDEFIIKNKQLIIDMHDKLKI